jgi:hypothetical protein
MPGHTLYNSEHDTPYDSYAQFVSSLRSQFDSIIACIHVNDVRKGHWPIAFEDVGIPWVTGADSFDQNSLIRMSMLFKRFEFMTTNSLGSHIPYAAYFGSKVSICGPKAEVKESDMTEVLHYRENPHLLRYIFSASREYLEGTDSPFLVSPSEAVQRTEFGQVTLGVSAKKKPHEVAELLGWNSVGRAELMLRHTLSRGYGIPRRILRRLNIY